ncbi:MAG TPA: formate dehydrogenase accessory sulfurtransferase FdhD [Lichenihabitans sp.]|nr:formate dehydrogenase accessory sulfurtransferase FdhD [Lichenihabitans sp.]
MVATSRPAGAVLIEFSQRRPRAIAPEVPAEVPVQVAYADIPFGIMMMTPADLDDFAYGFSLTEGVIERAADIRGIAIEEGSAGAVLRVDLVAARLQTHLARRRAMAGRTSCGLCGIEDFDSLPRARLPAGPAPEVSLAAVRRALGTLDAHQPLNGLTHAVHGAAWADDEGRIVLAREDVGRHNALDKLVGACLRTGVVPGAGFVLVTSRASYEMVEKAATFGARTLVAISGPTALAVERARALDITLIGIARRDAVTIFNGAERVVIDTQAPG